MKISSVIIGIIIGGLITFFGLENFVNKDANAQDSKEKVRKPAYWVAPMDANYRKDKPGKSPMGMDLVPFYEDEITGPDEGPGTIRISSAVINNLGVRTALVEYKEMESIVNTVGYVNFDEDQLVNINPRVKGWIEKLYVKASGDPVKKGQALYDIYSPEMVNAQEEYLLALKRNNVRLIKAAKNRLIALQIPKRAIDRLELTKKVKQTVTFYSPQSGVIDKLKIRQGFYAKPGTTLMSIGTLKQVWVNAEIFERQAAQIKVGVPVDMTLDYLPGKLWSGKVDYIYPTVDVKTRTIKVRLRFDNKDEVLKPGMFAQVLIHGIKSQNSLVVPKSAVIRTGNSKRVVLALGEGKYKSINVNVGRINDTYAQILSTLKEGDRVVTSAQFLLDSESSKTSDFIRMTEVEEAKNQEEQKSSDNIVWTKATVVKLMSEDNAIKVTHEAIPSWKWPTMTMNFDLGSNVSMDMFKVDMKLDIQITKTKDNAFIITDTKIKGADPKEWASASVVKLMKEDNSIKVNHSAIPAWKWPSMTMNFEIGKNVNFDMFKVGMDMDIEITKTKDNAYIITNVKMKKAQPQEWAKATIVKIMSEDNALKVTHSAIPAWKWPTMTMNFEIDKKIDFKQFKVGMDMDILIRKTIDNAYIVRAVKNLEAK